MFDAPTRPLAEGVVGPMPPIFVKDRDTIAKLGVRALRPGDSRELADVNDGPMAPLEVKHRLEGRAQEFLVQLFRRAGVRGPQPILLGLRMHALMGIVAWTAALEVRCPQHEITSRRTTPRSWPSVQPAWSRCWTRPVRASWARAHVRTWEVRAAGHPP